MKTLIFRKNVNIPEKLKNRKKVNIEKGRDIRKIQKTLIFNEKLTIPENRYKSGKT